MNWSHDISQAPRGKTIETTKTVKGEQRTVTHHSVEFVLAATPAGTVIQSYWIPPRYTQSGALLEGNRWSGFNVGSDPIAWAPWPTYEPVAKAEPVPFTHHTFLEDAGGGA